MSPTIAMIASLASVLAVVGSTIIIVSRLGYHFGRIEEKITAIDERGCKWYRVGGHDGV